ncbi:two-component system, sensor histidine kinase [Gammaproteobacteria bacterium]
MEQLKEVEQRWSFALEGTGEGVWDWDLAADKITFSKHWYEIQGFEAGSIGTTASDWRKLVHPDDILIVEKTLQEHFEGKSPNFFCEHRVRCKNGEYKWILGRGKVVARDSKGKVLRAIGTHLDITDRKIAEIERNRLLDLIMEAPDFIASSDMESNLTFINPAGARLVGLTKDCDITKLQIKDMHPTWATKRVLEEGIPEVLRQGYWSEETALLNSVTGQEIPVSQLLLLHRDVNGIPEKLSTIMRDISSFKRSEQLLRDAKEIAESLSRAKSEFLANMSHEIRTPMNGIIGLSQLALDQLMTPVIRDYLQKIYFSSKSLLGILNDILDFSKMEAGRMSIENRPFNLDQVIDSLRNLFEERIRAKHLDFKIEISKRMPRDFVGDSMRIQQILSNLIGNAEKFTSHGHIAVKIWIKRLEGSQAQLCFAVEDTGIGISEDDLSKLFKPFSQVDASITRKFGGTGLGLAISQKLLQLMGGNFKVPSKQGQGTTFSFDVLLGIGEFQHTRDTPRRTKQEVGNLKQDLQQLATKLKGSHILVVEDNAINQQVMKGFLALSSIEVSIADNGQEALNLLEQQTFDAILMDVHMPVMGGVEATKRIRLDQKYLDLPIIALTAGVTQEEQDKCLASGMNDFIAKPINPENLITTLTKWVKPTELPERSSSSLTIAGIVG